MDTVDAVLGAPAWGRQDACAEHKVVLLVVDLAGLLVDLAACIEQAQVRVGGGLVLDG